MASFQEIFDKTEVFLKKKGISSEIAKGELASTADLEYFEQQSGLILPDSFSLFYTSFANGFNFCWEFEEEIQGQFAMPTLLQLGETYRDWRSNVQDFYKDPNSLDRCVELVFRTEAFAVWRRMEPWVPFWNEGNGDHFCVDSKTGQIVYDQHDWYDGFGSLTKTNGILAGHDFGNFLHNWSRFCFLPNTGHWWGEFGKFGAIKWSPEFFNPKFYRQE